MFICCMYKSLKSFNEVPIFCTQYELTRRLADSGHNQQGAYFLGTEPL